MPWSKLRYRLGLEQIPDAPRYRRVDPLHEPLPPVVKGPKTPRTTRDPYEQAEAMRKELHAGKCAWAPSTKRKARR